MNLIIAGSRNVWPSDGLITESLDRFGLHPDAIISGTAGGADRCGERWAINNGVALQRMPANWGLYGKSAGYRRNEQMAAIGDALLAFHDGSSRGTMHMIDIMRRAGKPVYVVKVIP